MEAVLTLKNDKRHQMFWIPVGDKKAYIIYELMEKDLLDLVYTYVPKQFRNKGVAAQLTRQVLEYVSSNNYHILTSCPYIKNFIGDNPEYKRLVVKTEAER